MIRISFVLALLAALALLLVGGTQAASEARVTKVFGQVGPGFTITLKNRAGKRIRRLKPGLYTFVIQDRATNHNFHLVGRGVRKATAVGFLGTKFWRKVRLKKGTYRYWCDPHKPTMHRSFRVR